VVGFGGKTQVIVIKKATNLRRDNERGKGDRRQEEIKGRRKEEAFSVNLPPFYSLK
jgi:hypothetical protein